MKPDLYTKAVLTIIAVCLVIIVIDKLNPVTAAYAGAPGRGSAGYVNYSLVPLNDNGSIDVNIMSVAAPMEVDVKKISTYDRLKVDLNDVTTSDEIRVVLNDINTTEKLKVSLEEVNVTAFTQCTVPVKIKQ